MDIRLDNMIGMSWTAVAEAAERGAVVLLPLGVIEEHGPHLCLGTDIYTAQEYCARIAGKLRGHGKEVVIAPPFYWGICQSTRGFTGSFGIRMETAENLVVDILTSLTGYGFREIYGVNAHGDIEQNVLFMNGFRKAGEQTGTWPRYCFRKEILHHYGLNGGELFICPVEPSELTVSRSSEPDVHAGDIETAVIHHCFPECADTARAETLPAVSMEPDRVMEWLLGGKTREISPNGYLGNPALYGAVDVETHLNDVAERYVRAILGG